MHVCVCLVIYEYVSSGKAVVACLKMTQDILSLFPLRISDHILSLEKEHNLINLIIHFSSTPFSDPSSPSEPPVEVKGMSGGGGLLETVYIVDDTELNERLTFLDYITSNSTLTLTEATVTHLWNTLINPKNPSENQQKKLLKWLGESLNKQASSSSSSAASSSFSNGTRLMSVKEQEYVTFAPEVVNYIFNSLLCNSTNLSYSNLSKDGINCFLKYLCYVNHQAARLSSSDPTNIIVTDSDPARGGLSGLESLWSIYLNSRLEPVRTSAGQALIKLYIRVNYQWSTEDKHRVWTRFLTNCLSLLEHKVDLSRDAIKIVFNEDCLIVPAVPREGEKTVVGAVDEGKQEVDVFLLKLRVTKLLSSFIKALDSTVIRPPCFQVGHQGY